LDAAKARYRIQRTALLEKYGKACAACGCTDPVVLTLDHVNDDGHLDRKEKAPKVIYREALEQHRPDLQVLCANCQLRKVNLGPDFTRWGWTDRCVCGKMKRGVNRDPT